MLRLTVVRSFPRTELYASWPHSCSSPWTHIPVDTKGSLYFSNNFSRLYSDSMWFFPLFPSFHFTLSIFWKALCKHVLIFLFFGIISFKLWASSLVFYHLRYASSSFCFESVFSYFWGSSGAVILLLIPPEELGLQIRATVPNLSLTSCPGWPWSLPPKELGL
jgi:hypothetical protein